MTPARVGTKLSSSKSSLGKLIDVQNADKSPEPDGTGLHIGSQVGKNHNILSLKTNPVCHSSSKTSLRVKLPLGNITDVQDTDKLSDPVAIGFT